MKGKSNKNHRHDITSCLSILHSNLIRKRPDCLFVEVILTAKIVYGGSETQLEVTENVNDVVNTKYI